MSLEVEVFRSLRPIDREFYLLSCEAKDCQECTIYNNELEEILDEVTN